MAKKLSEMVERFNGNYRVLSIFRKDVALVSGLVGIILLFAIGSYMSPSFLTLNNLQNFARNSSILGTVAIGVTIVFLIKEIDISVGSIMAFSILISINIVDIASKCLGMSVIQGGHYVTGGGVPIMVLTVLVGAVIGFFNGFLVTKARINSVIVTLGVLYTARGLSYIVSGGHSIYLTRTPGFSSLGGSNVFGIPVPTIVFVVLAAVLIILMHFSIMGKRIYAIGGNERAAKLAGINTDRWKIFAFTISGLLAGISGLMYSSHLQSADPQQAFGYEFLAIAIVVLGGTVLEGGKGSIAGTLVAAFVIGLLNNVLDLIGITHWYQKIVTGVIIILAVLPSYFKKSN